jgi:hypothetical protein
MGSWEGILSTSIRLPSFGGNNQDCGCIAVLVYMVMVRSRRQMLAGVMVFLTIVKPRISNMRTTYLACKLD